MTVYILVILGVLVAANFLANRYDKTYDATANKRFTLSDETKKVVGELKQNVTIEYFDQSSGFQAGKDLLDRYANLSPKVHVQYVDLLKNPVLARAMNVSRQGEAIVELGAKREEAKTFDEEGITGRFVRRSKAVSGQSAWLPATANIAWTTAPPTACPIFRLPCRRQLQGRAGRSAAEGANSTECTVLVIAGPTGDYIQPEVDTIKKYVEDGGRAMFLLDPPLRLGRNEISDNGALVTLLATWGVTPEKDLLLDENPVSQLVGLDATVPLVTAIRLPSDRQ